MSNASAPAPTPARAERRYRDMVISLVVLLVPIAVFLVLFRFSGDEEALIVDPGNAIAEAQRAAAFPVAVPGDPGEGWRSVSAAFQPKEQGATLRIGYLSPSGGGIQLVESSEPTDPLLIRELGDQTRPTGFTTVGSRTWDTYEIRGGSERALVATEPGRTLIVVGQADVAELEHLAAALE